MPFIEGYAETERAARYVEQLGSHFGHGPGGMKVLASAPGELVVDLGGATWTLRSEPTRLELRVEADDPGVLRQFSERVTERIEKLGRRDHLKVHWQR
ncbi:DUF2218 domain-containing protein [Kribbella kalugense]|uniref:DUF2218 domain-containing protein n=1 Tax=Kribbella kalugense TaxID=2512221 RepID=A0A4R7ZRX5_9ACTN|nr:DUF2218 domain-containing protein [Kribbella kalugense]TDW19591.1 hypothetical protein EV650_6201 [Kribbella kalugense]